MDESRYNVLFLCTHNSARSVMAEAILNNLPGARGRFRAYSAGSYPRGQVNPYALEHLARIGLPTHALRSKSWDEFAKAGAPHMHFVFTVCDNAANEACPAWPGQPMTAHWGVPDPSETKGTEAEIRVAFARTFDQLRNRIMVFASLPLAKLGKLALKKKLDDIGRL